MSLSITDARVKACLPAGRDLVRRLRLVAERTTLPRPVGLRRSNPWCARDRNEKERAEARLFHFARVKGFEPSTSSVTGKRSNQLSYTRNNCYKITDFWS